MGFQAGLKGKSALSHGPAGYMVPPCVVAGVSCCRGDLGGCLMPVFFWQKEIHGGLPLLFLVWAAGGEGMLRVRAGLRVLTGLGSLSVVGDLVLVQMVPGLIFQQFLVVLPWVALKWTVSGSMRHCLSRCAMSGLLIFVSASSSTCLRNGSRKK